MIEYVRNDVSRWLSRSLEKYYPIVFVDCVHIKVHRRRKVASEAFYVVLAVTEEGTREVIVIFNLPTESAAGWRLMFEDLKKRGLEQISLIVADGIPALIRL